jgi:signal transduction histidine kinase
MAANLRSVAGNGRSGASHGHGDSGLEAKYRTLLERYQELLNWQHRSERRTSAVAKMASWAMQASTTGWAMVRGGELYFTNPAFRALSHALASGQDWQSAPSMNGKHPRRVATYPTLRELALREAASCLLAGRRMRGRFRREQQIIEVNLERALLPGSELAVLVMVEDVTKLARAEAEVRTSRELLIHRERLRAIGELAFGIAHDLNNTLAALRLRLSVIEKDPACVASQGLNLRTSLRILGQGSALITKLQDLGRRDPPTVTSVDLDDTIRCAIDIAHSGLGLDDQRDERRIRIRTDVPPLPPIRGYTEDLKHLFVNLLINARDAMSSGGEIWVRARREGSGVVVRVEDEGHGIPAEHLPRIFEPFFSTKGDKGTGMGLAMAKILIERLGGSIIARNRPEGGACFELHFVPYPRYRARPIKRRRTA